MSWSARAKQDAAVVVSHGDESVRVRSRHSLRRASSIAGEGKPDEYPPRCSHAGEGAVAPDQCALRALTRLPERVAALSSSGLPASGIPRSLWWQVPTVTLLVQFRNLLAN